MGRQALSTAPRGRVGRALERSHVIEINGSEVALVLRHSARRSFALQVDHRGARVAVPHGTPLAAVERFVRGHGDWLLRKLDHRQRAMAATRFVPEDGARFPLLGRTARVRTGVVGRSVRWCVGADGIEELHLPGAGSSAAMLRALRNRAIAWFRGRVEEYCLRLGQSAPRVGLSSARTRWGSCSRHGGIRLNWRLVHLEPALIDYVVAHEVAHLLEMNHSPRFWSVVEGLYPNWQEARRQLRAQGAELPLITMNEQSPISDEE